MLTQGCRDVNGDGRDDLLWIEKFSGDTYVWYNDGRKDPSQAAGSSIGWRPQAEKAYAGLAAGTCTYYAGTSFWSPLLSLNEMPHVLRMRHFPNRRLY